VPNRATVERGNRPAKGFTLLELLAVIATIGTLAALLLPVLAKAKSKAHQTTCISNLKQLGMAWNMYHSDNSGRLVESYPVANPNVWVKGSMADRFEATNEDLIKAGKLYPYNESVTVYRCPTDRGVVLSDGDRVRSVRSYSMNGFMGRRDASTGLIPSRAVGYVPFFTKDSDLNVGNPSELWVMLDEDERSINDGFFVTDPTGSIWFDFPSIASYRHRFSYSLSFADGHAEPWSLQDPDTRKVIRNQTEQYGNRDLLRLGRASTVKR
jgi:prepilin-type N-terminal cleavage/methylation domain-containing protein